MKHEARPECVRGRKGEGLMEKERILSGPWSVFSMVNEDGSPKTAKELGEYVAASVRWTEALNGGVPRPFLFVSAQAEDGTSRDVCHVGNGPMGPWNALAIAAVPEMVAALRLWARVATRRDGTPASHEDVVMTFVEDGSTLTECLAATRAALAKVDGESEV